MSRTAWRAGACAVVALAAGAASLPATAATRAVAPVAKIVAHAQPDAGDYGQNVVIWGRVTGRKAAHHKVTIRTRASAIHGRFHRLRVLRTDAHGFFRLIRPGRSVRGSYSWFAVAGGHRSRQQRQLVRALVSLDAPAGVALPGQPLTLTGRLTPGTANQPVQIQEQSRNGAWRNTGLVATTDRSGRFTASVTYPNSSVHALRAHFAGSRSLLGADSDSVDIVLQRPQNAKVALAPSSPVLAPGTPLTLTGRMLVGRPGGRTMVLLAGTGKKTLHSVAQTTTAADGTFTFTLQPSATTLFEAVVPNTNNHSTIVVTAVGTAVSARASTLRPRLGRRVRFTGSVQPLKSAHVVELQHRGVDGRWHTVALSRISSTSTFAINWVADSPGRTSMRLKVEGGPENLSTGSRTFTLNVSPPRR